MSDLAKRINEIARKTGSFTLRSGKITNLYFDKFQFQADPALLDRITLELAARVPADTEVLAGLELGGIPVVTSLSRQTGLPCAFVRKQPKAHGMKRLAEGTEIDGRRVLVVEDVITTAGQTLISTEQMRALGARIDNAMCVIDRQEGGERALAQQGIKLISLLTREDLDRACN